MLQYCNIVEPILLLTSPYGLYYARLDIAPLSLLHSFLGGGNAESVAKEKQTESSR